MNITTIEALEEIEDGTTLKLLQGPNTNGSRFDDLGGAEVRKEGRQVWIGQVPVPATSLNAAMSNGLLVGPEEIDLTTLEIGQGYRSPGNGTYFILGFSEDTERYDYLWFPEREGGRMAVNSLSRDGMYGDIAPHRLEPTELALATGVLGLIQRDRPDTQALVTQAREEGRRAGLNELRTALVDNWDEVNYQAHELNEVLEGVGLDPLPPPDEEIGVEVEFSGDVLLANGRYISVSQSETFEVTGPEGTCACDLITHEMILDRFPGIENLYVDSTYCRHD